jgi:hypothetical protein
MTLASCDQDDGLVGRHACGVVCKAVGSVDDLKIALIAESSCGLLLLSIFQLLEFFSFL